MRSVQKMKNRIRRTLSQRKKERITDEHLTCSAVLVPLYERAGEPYLLFTRRTERLNSHKGQISFPGGRCQSDETTETTALRESWEEIGIRPEDVEVLGEMSDAVTLTTNYVISPFVGVIPYPYQFRMSQYEVAEIIEVPVEALMNSSCYRVVETLNPEEEAKYRQLARIYEGRSSMAWFYEYDNHVIWGATARIVKCLLELISETGAI